MASANVLPIIDTSASMSAYGYAQITQTDSEAFIRSAVPEDRIGVVSYDVDGRITYPTSGNQLVTVDWTLQQTRDAAAQIQKLVFQGNCTNIGGGISTARGMMDSAPFPKGLVLLSDGYQNCGTNPLNVLPPYPIYSCAMGPMSDQQLMYTIAQRTGGSYWFAPTAFDMMLIFNEIRAQLQPLTGVALNVRDTMPSQGAKSFQAPISAQQPTAQFSFVWNDPTIAYTPDAPQQDQVRVQLLDPSGVLWPQPPQVIDRGYVIFNVEAASQGEWSISVEFGTKASDTVVTAAGLEFDNAVSHVALHVGTPKEIERGATIDITAHLTKDGAPVELLGATASCVKPPRGSAKLLEEVRDELGRGEVKHLPKALRHLHARPSLWEPLGTPQTSGGTASWSVTADEAGSMTFHVVARGQRHGIAVQRTAVFSVLVTESR